LAAVQWAGSPLSLTEDGTGPERVRGGVINQRMGIMGARTKIFRRGSSIAKTGEVVLSPLNPPQGVKG